jgi:hypothetical protein
MGTVLDAYIGHAWEAVSNLSRETVGFIPAAYKSTSADKVKFNQEIQIPFGIVGDAVDTPIGFGVPTAQTNAEPLNYVSLVMNKRKTVPIDIDGEDQAGLAMTGTEADVRTQQFSEAFRKIVNLMEADMSDAAVIGSSRAVGSAGTSPFATAGDFTTFAQAQNVLDSNGASPNDRVMILSSAAKTDLMGKQGTIFNSNQYGSSDPRMYGVINENMYGFAVRSSIKLAKHTAGGGTLYVLASAVVGADTGDGDTDMSVGTGTGTILAGDYVTLAGDTNKYIVGTGITAPGTAVINKPGFRQSAAISTAVTLGSTYTPSIGFQKNAIVLATRTPFYPREGDGALGREYVTDPVSGITFEIAMYPGQRKTQIQVSACWGVKVVNPRHVVTMLG